MTSNVVQYPRKGSCTGHFLTNPNSTQWWSIEWKRNCDMDNDPVDECMCLDLYQEFVGVNPITLAHVPCKDIRIRLDPYINYGFRVSGLHNDLAEGDLRTVVPGLPPGVSKIVHAYGSYYKLKNTDLWRAMDHAFRCHRVSSPGPYNCDSRNLAWMICTKAGTLPETEASEALDSFIQSSEQRKIGDKLALELTIGHAVRRDALCYD